MIFYKNPILITGLCMLGFQGISQKKTFSGIILDSASHKPLGMASIRNVMSGVATISKKDGSFLTSVTPGQVIAFSANGYYTDTLTITSNILQAGPFTKLLRFLPSTLPDVTITGTYTPYQNDSIERRKQFLQTVGENKIPVVSKANDMGFGVGINLDHFGKKEKNKREARSLFDITEEEAYINYRWNEEIVKKYTGYKDDKLTSFMQQARPSYTWLRNHLTEEDLLYYIDSQLKKMKKSNHPL